MISRRAARFAFGVALVGAMLLAGCTPPSESTAASPAASATASERDGWSAASWERRHDIMTFVVLPNMAREFQAFQGKRDPDLTCRSCHGADAEEVGYAMPHGLPALDPEHLPNPNGSDARARLVKFMNDTVTPRMAQLLEVALYDARTHSGFGCFNCHPRSKVDRP